MFTQFKKLLFVIQKDERKKFVLMSALIFLILFNYSAISSLKDCLILSTLGPESISYIELWLVLPSVFIFTVCYLKLETIITNKAIMFYLVSSFFLLFFILFAYLLYPNLEALKPNSTWLHSWTHKFISLKRLIIVCEYWPLSLFNIFSELWINVLLSLLFWQYANSITSSEQAKRFYPMFGLIGNFSLIVYGFLMKQIFISSNTTEALQSITIVIVIVGLIAMLVFGYSYNFLPQKVNILGNINEPSKKKLSFTDSIKLIINSKYLWLLTISLISYGTTINLSLGLYKAVLIKLYTTTQNYIEFTAVYQKWLGITSIIFMLFTSILVRKLSWLKSAITTPIIMLVTGSLFFTWVICHAFLTEIMSEHVYLTLTVFIGSVYIILTKSSKFSLFNITKEMAYIPLNEHLRDKGKAAVDVLGERIGKSGGVVIQTILLASLPRSYYLEFTSIFFLISIFMWAIWIIAIRSLNIEYLKMLDKDLKASSK